MSKEKDTLNWKVLEEQVKEIAKWPEWKKRATFGTIDYKLWRDNE
jgi:hypothetical protein